MDVKRKQALCIVLLLLDDEEELTKKKRARRSIWVKPWLQRRAEPGIYSNLFQELLEAKSLKDYIRMDKMHFDYLVERLYPYLIKQDTITRESILTQRAMLLILTIRGKWRNLSFLRISISGHQAINSKNSRKSSRGYY